MEEPIEEIYFNWLYSTVASVDVPTPSLTYWTLLRDLHMTQFVWAIEGDDNRAEDGLDLRKQFLRQSMLPQDPAWTSIPCSVLEMLIAFANKASFETNQDARDWFWQFMHNLGLDELNDAKRHISEQVNEVMDQFIWRTYKPNGEGGLFPLQEPSPDQRHVEILYQFNYYLVEHEH